MEKEINILYVPCGGNVKVGETVAELLSNDVRYRDDQRVKALEEAFNIGRKALEVAEELGVIESDGSGSQKYHFQIKRGDDVFKVSIDTSLPGYLQKKYDLIEVCFHEYGDNIAEEVKKRKKISGCLP